MSVAPGHADAAYVALPQAPDAAYAGHPSVPTGLDGENDMEDMPLHAGRPLRLDSRVRWILFMLGSAVLLPWNVMITATPYFLSRLSDTLRPPFSSYISITFTVANFVFLARATATSKQASNILRTRLNLVILSVLVFALYFSTHLSLSPGIFAAGVLAAAALQAAAGSFLQTAVTAEAALFGPSAMQALMSGQAAVGVAVSAVQLLSAYGSVRGALPSPSADGTVVVESAEDDGSAAASARAFFALSTVFLLATVGAHAWLVRLPAYASLTDTSRGVREDPDEHVVSSKDQRSQIMRVARANWVYEVAVALVFTVTLAVFPPITISVAPLNPSTHPLLFTATHFLLFNAGDLAGRLLCAFPRLLIWSGPRLLLLSAARIAFIPLFLLCNVRAPRAPARTPLLASDGAFFALLLAFGASNGFVSTMCMVAAPSAERNPALRGRRADVDTAATVASFCLVGGLALGSAASFGVRAWVCGCNPLSG